MYTGPRQVEFYRTSSGREPFRDFVTSLKDTKAISAILARVKRLGEGNLGDHGRVGGGVVELRIDLGPGYRIYIGLRGQELVILLCAGKKASQREDIRQAIEYWRNCRGEQ